MSATVAKKARGAIKRTKKPLFSSPKPWKPGKNLLDWAFQWKDYGVGRRFARKLWQYPEPCFYTITRIEPTAYMGANMKRAKVWGLKTWRGVQNPTEHRLRGVLKREWVYIPPDKEPPTFQPDPAVLARAFEYKTLKKPSYDRDEEKLDLVFDVDHRAEIVFRYEHLYDLNRKLPQTTEALPPVEAQKEAELK